MKPVLRNRIYYLRRSVPRRFQRIEDRKEIWISLETDSYDTACTKLPGVWNTLVSAWEAKLAGDSSDAEARFEAARDLAKTRGFRFLPIERVARLPMGQLLDRVDAVGMRKSGRPDMMDAGAFLGGARQPEITVSRALEIFWSLAVDRTRGKAENQLRIWRNTRKKAVANFIEVVGDLPLQDISPDDTLDFREWWWNRIVKEGLAPNTANKDFSALANILKTVNDKKRLGLNLPLTGLSIREDEKGRRPPLPDDWIRDVIMAPGALDGMNTEARCILLGMINTGYRPSEGANLLSEHIHLDTNIPHIEIRPVNRTLKTKHSQRIIPITGISLEAFKTCPEGFPRYRDNSGPTATVNKYLRENGLMPGEKHVMYSLRHSFEDRLLAADVDERIRRDLMGHRLNRERYGQGASLEKMYGILDAIAL